MAEKYVYCFGSKGTDGDASMKNLLGGKGANLAEMAKLGMPVPAGFTITTEFCSAFFDEGGKFPQSLKDEVAAALKQTEECMGMKYGAPENDLLKRLAADKLFSAVKAELPKLTEPARFIGRAPKQVEEFIATVIAPIRRKYAADMGMSAELEV